MSLDNPFLSQVICVWIALGALLSAAIWRLSRALFLGGIDWRRLWAPFGLFAVALAARVLISPHTLIHENAHGYEFVRAAFSLEGYFYHGSAYYAFMHPFTALFGQRAEVIFWVNALLGAACAPLLLAVGQRVLPGWRSGLFAALLWSCWPLALRVGHSESMFPLALAAALASWWLWFEAWERGGWTRFCLAAAALSVAVQVRPQMALWPGVLVLSLWTIPGWSGRLRSVGPWLALFLSAGLCAPWLLFRVEVLGQEGVPGFLGLDPLTTLRGLFSGDNLLLQTAWTPVVVVILGFVGLGWLMRMRLRALPALVGGFLLLAWFVIGVRTGETSSVRLQQPMQLLFLLWAGAGASFLAGLSMRLHRFVPLALALLLVGLCLARIPKIQESKSPQEEFAFLEQEVPRLDPRCWIVQADRFMADRVVSTEFPRWLTSAPVVELTPFLADDRLRAEAPCAIFYLGVSCYWHRHEEAIAPDGLRPACRSWQKEFRLEPLVEQRFDARPDTPFRVFAGPLTIGFYRMLPRSTGPLPAERPPDAAAGAAPP